METINTKVNTESQYENKFIIRHVKSNAEVRILFNPENTTAQEIVSSLNNHYALVEALKDFVNGIDIIVDGMKEGERLNCYKSLQNSLTYKNAKELLNNIK